MFGFGTPRKKALYGALFDIGSESIGVAITESDPSAQFPRIIFSHRVHMRLTKKILSLEDRVRMMKEALFSASLIMSRDGLEALTLHNKHARVTHILVACSAPWSRTISRNVAYEGDAEVKVSKDLIDDLISSAESEIEKNLTSELGASSLNFEVVERATIDVRINDYPVKHPAGLSGKAVSLAHVTGLVPREIITALTEVEEKIFPHTTIRTHTFMLVLYCVLRELYTEHTSMTIIHVTGDTTEFGLVEGDTLVETIAAPVGIESVVRSMMENDKETSHEMYTLLELYEKKQLNGAAEVRVKRALDEYQKAITDAFLNEAKSRRFPKIALVLAPSPFTSLFTAILEPFIKETLGITSEILTLKLDTLGTTPTHDERDANLDVTSRFFHKLHGCGEIETK